MTRGVTTRLGFPHCGFELFEPRKTAPPGAYAGTGTQTIKGISFRFTRQGTWPGPTGRAANQIAVPDFLHLVQFSRLVHSHSVMILPQVHLRKPCYDFYFL
jgi:hypothetical protein